MPTAIQRRIERVEEAAKRLQQARPPAALSDEERAARIAALFAHPEGLEWQAERLLSLLGVDYADD